MKIRPFGVNLLLPAHTSELPIGSDGRDGSFRPRALDHGESRCTEVIYQNTGNVAKKPGLGCMHARAGRAIQDVRTAPRLALASRATLLHACMSMPRPPAHSQLPSSDEAWGM